MIYYMQHGLLNIWLLSVLFVLSAAQESGPVVDLGYVKLRGKSYDALGLNAFRGVKYAQPPVDVLRWRAPKPIEDKNDYNGAIINATEQGNICPQGKLPYKLRGTTSFPGTQSEDCLVLDVVVPKKPKSDKLPVLLLIHGGGFISGAIANSGIGLMTRANDNMIFVEIQYRLGMFGFLAGDEIQQDGDFNVGVRDQRAALEWVQRHISKFGGDPKKVTLWGQSAGGCSVSIQQIAYGGKGDPPFRAAIPDFPGWNSMLNRTTQNTQFQNVLKEAGCKDLDCLRSKPMDELVKVNVAALASGYPSPGYNFGQFYYNPVVDGDFIPELLTESFKKGNYYKTPVITEHSSYEGYYFTDLNITKEAEFQDAMALFAGGSEAGNEKAFAQEVLYKEYPESDFNSTLFHRVKWFGDLIYNCPTYTTAKHMVHTGPVFKMLFDAGTQTHAAAGPFINSPTPNYPTSVNQTLVDFLTSYWISFVQTLDPNTLKHPDAPYWKPYHAVDKDGKYNTLKITYTTAGNAPDGDQSSYCAFWEKNALALPQ